MSDVDFWQWVAITIIGVWLAIRAVTPVKDI